MQQALFRGTDYEKITFLKPAVFNSSKTNINQADSEYINITCKTYRAFEKQLRKATSDFMKSVCPHGATRLQANGFS